MAARLRTQHQDEVRAKIQSAQLINRLSAIASGEVTGENLGVQVQAALGLLKKVVPDLASVQHAVEDGMVLNINLGRNAEGR
jgi:hypothetical protein